MKELDSFKCLLAAGYRRVPDIIEITRTRPAASLEASDFSHAGIERRAEEGRTIAREALALKGFSD